MITTLKKAIIYFNLDKSHYQKRIDRYKKDYDKASQDIINELILLRDDKADNTTLIAYILNHISYKKILIKYDIINASNLDVLIYYEDIQHSEW